jgi:ubiquinone/menaquinone biosynthesis C-methylase UbiE
MQNKFTIEQVADFWNNLGGKYDDANENFQEVHNQRYEKTIEYLNLRPNDKILNVWSRTGNAIPYLRKEAGLQIENLEVADVFIEKAQKRFPEEKFQKTDLERLPFGDNYFDKILSLETLEHTPEPSVFLKELRRVLKPEGILVMSLPPQTAEAAEKISRWFFGNHGEGPHKFLSSRKVKKLLTETDLKLIKHEGTLLIPFGPQWLRKFGEQIIKIFQKTPISELGIRQFYVCKK